MAVLKHNTVKAREKKSQFLGNIGANTQHSTWKQYLLSESSISMAALHSLGMVTMVIEIDG